MNTGSRFGRGALFATAAVVAVMSADAAWAQTKIFNIPEQSAAGGVASFARQADVQALITADAADGRRTNAVIGSFTTSRALEQLLRGTGLEARTTSAQTWSIVVAGENAETEVSFLPEILVEGQINWTLNTDIRRTEDDPQPYVVFTAEDLARSGAVNLDQFFRDNLGAATGASVSETSPLQRGRSQINLRGLGADQTLILVDGRRLPNVNTGAGTLEQPTIVGIPIAQIERIEVLPSSASSVYGGGATGGVINIIMKRNYRGLEITTTYADVFEGSAADKRVDLSGGMNLGNGRTNISASLSWRDIDPLLQGERDFLQRGRAFFAEENPAWYNTNLIGGATPNILSATGAPLVLDAAYGGASLGSNHTHLPYGYRGLAQDGVAALIANAGSYNLDLAPTAAGQSRFAQLTTGQESISGSLAVRHEMTSWLRLYGEAQAQKTETEAAYNRIGGIVTLAANAPNNPFQQAIQVAVPHVGADAPASSRGDTRRFLGGALIDLPFHWQANLDYSYNWSRFTSTDGQPAPDAATSVGLSNGTLDIMRDLTLAPLSYGYLSTGTGVVRTPSESTTKSTSLRLAGPLPITLPGGRPAITFLAERTDVWIGDSVAINNTATQSSISYTPERTQTTDSAYLEMRAPIIGPENNIPFVYGLEFQVSARYDSYEGRGARNNLNCLFVFRPLTDEDIASACPPGGVEPDYATASRSHADPTYALKWQPTRDIAFRGSYGTGYLPPLLNQLVRVQTGFLSVNVVDPERGGEVIGTPLFPGFTVLIGPDNFFGGNPDILPERSETVSFGTIITPRWIPNLRLSIDWTTIEKADVYFSPQALLSPAVNTSETQDLFEDFLRSHPERFVRGPASGGFAVGPITGIDASFANLPGATVETVDFALEYSRPVWGGELAFTTDATWLQQLSVQQSESAPILDWAGVASGLFQGLGGGFGGVKWKGNAQLRWSDDKLTVGWRARYFGSYLLNRLGDPDPAQLDPRIPSQIYHDLYGTYALRGDLDLRVGVNNVLNQRPPLDLSTSTYYSRFGDPRLRSFYVALTKRF